jgi:plasmid maintenance system antidote protein VapI
VNQRRGVTPSTAVRLAQFFGMSSEFWMNLQTGWDLYHAEKSDAAVLKRIRPYQKSRQRKAS